MNTIQLHDIKLLQTTHFIILSLQTCVQEIAAEVHTAYSMCIKINFTNILVLTVLKIPLIQII